ncbi:hypothetical protein O3G_MSEX009110 [Manduca sexta]|uniref:Odorant receptor n=1 Tax=Manduca sexta TaxID=7130 RepID=A0A5K8B129_MANSE|nr:hypothetical protein O3G_MSEX009110 [Manduca sexta]CUQ99308.1 TPA: Olfactory receptor 75 [Manduca sexta]
MFTQLKARSVAVRRERTSAGVASLMRYALSSITAKCMSSFCQTDIFKPNLFFWKCFGIWGGRTENKNYKYYSFSYLFVTLFVYNILLTINLIYTPLKIESLIREVIFYFTEIAVTAKVLMILVMRSKIIEAFNLLDCKEFKGDDEESKRIIETNNSFYRTCWKLYAVLSNVSYSSQVFAPLFINLIWTAKIELPVCKYYFLSDEMRDKYFIFWFIYQSFGIYGHMMYNVNVDSFIAGLILMAITQLKVLNAKFTNFNLEKRHKKRRILIQDKIQIMRLNRYLKHYDCVLRYCATIQDILSVTMFVQFGMASAIMCVVMCGLLLPSTTETFVFMVTYLFAMMMQIFVPAWLGTQLSHESCGLVFAAYNCEWIPRSMSFKRSIMIFVERANNPIQLTGLKMFPLSLATFTSIMKTAYSFFTLFRNLQDHDDGAN